MNVSFVSTICFVCLANVDLSYFMYGVLQVKKNTNSFVLSFNGLTQDRLASHHLLYLDVSTVHCSNSILQYHFSSELALRPCVIYVVPSGKYSLPDL